MNQKIEWPTLFKRDQLGRIRQWTIYCTDKIGYPQYVVSHGLQDGKSQSTAVDIMVGKNIGRANETSAWQQCVNEAQSLWQKQKDRKGYVEKLNNQQDKETRLVPPMLAKSYNLAGKDINKLKDGRKIAWPAYIQPKLDGCVSGDTLIKTKEYGYKTIKWLVENHIKCKVLSRNKNGRLEYKSISSYFQNKLIRENTQWYEIELERGEKLTITGNHPVYLPDFDCWRRVDQLEGNENLMLV
jgi:hypothetical protein